MAAGVERRLVRPDLADDLEPDAARPQFGLWRDRIFSARTDRWRLVWNPEGIEPKATPPGTYLVPEVALFDEPADPNELHDVSAEHAHVVKSLQDAVRTWLKGLQPCTQVIQGSSPEHIEALKALGYAGEAENAAPPKKSSGEK